MQEENELGLHPWHSEFLFGSFLFPSTSLFPSILSSFKLFPSIHPCLLSSISPTPLLFLPPSLSLSLNHFSSFLLSSHSCHLPFFLRHSTSVHPSINRSPPSNLVSLSFPSILLSMPPFLPLFLPLASITLSLLLLSCHAYRLPSAQLFLLLSFFLYLPPSFSSCPFLCFPFFLRSLFLPSFLDSSHPFSSLHSLSLFDVGVSL